MCVPAGARRVRVPSESRISLLSIQEPGIQRRGRATGECRQKSRSKREAKISRTAQRTGSNAGDVKNRSGRGRPGAVNRTCSGGIELQWLPRDCPAEWWLAAESFDVELPQRSIVPSSVMVSCVFSSIDLVIPGIESGWSSRGTANMRAVWSELAVTASFPFSEISMWFTVSPCWWTGPIRSPETRSKKRTVPSPAPVAMSRDWGTNATACTANSCRSSRGGCPA